MMVAHAKLKLQSPQYDMNPKEAYCCVTF
jgi:hypothetical protein